MLKASIDRCSSSSTMNTASTNRTSCYRPSSRHNLEVLSPYPTHTIYFALASKPSFSFSSPTSLTYCFWASSGVILSFSATSFHALYLALPFDPYQHRYRNSGTPTDTENCSPLGQKLRACRLYRREGLGSPA